MKKLTQKILSGFVGKIGIVSIAVICLAVFNSNTKAQSLVVNYDFASLIPGMPCMVDPLMTSGGVTATFSTGGTGSGICIASRGDSTGYGVPFADNEYNPGVRLLSTSADSKDYFQFQLDGVSAYRDYKLFFQARRITSIDVQYSLDGITFTDFTQLHFSPIQPLYHAFHVDLSSVAEIEGKPTVYFRLVGTSAADRNALFDIDNFQVQATSATKSRKRVRFF